MSAAASAVLPADFKMSQSSFTSGTVRLLEAMGFAAVEIAPEIVALSAFAATPAESAKPAAA